METTTFVIEQTVEDTDVSAAKEALQTILDTVKERIPSAVVSEITTEPAAEEQPQPLRYSVSHVD